MEEPLIRVRYLGAKWVEQLTKPLGSGLPVEFPQCSGRAVEAAVYEVSREFFGLRN
jgi:hypothetical protein